MRFCLNGPFRVYADDNRDLTPKGIKERGLLALLALSPGQRRTRAWLQDKLWSDRSPDQASGSCRQALSNIRKALGPVGAQLHSDRTAVWLTPLVSLRDAFDPSMGELLEDIDISDPEFTDWLRAMRMQQDAPLPPPNFMQPRQSSQDQRPIVVIRRIDRSGTGRGMFILRALSQRVAAGLAALGDLDITELDAEEKLLSDDQPTAWVDLECLDESDMAFVLLRVIGQPNRRIAWSGRLSIEPRLSVVWHSDDVTRTINRAVQAVGDTVISTFGLSPMATIQKAIRRKYEFDRTSLTKADDLLRGAMDTDLKGLALAWRGILRLEEVLEYRENNAERLAEAMDFVGQAALLAPHSAPVLAMVSEVTLFLTNDIDKASFLAHRAHALDDQDPEALAAYGRALSFEGRHRESHRFAQAARHYAQGLSYSYDWDLMAGVASIRVGDMAGGYEMALTCHRKMPFARHALRYLTVLSFLDDRPTDAMQFAGRLRRMEPDFNVQALLNNYEPLSNTRDTDLMDRLRLKLA